MRKRNGESGFTLLEMIVVSVILVVMAGILYGTINGILRGRNAVISEGSTNRVARYVLGRLNRELTSRAAEKLSASSAEQDSNSPSLNATAPSQQRYLTSENAKEGDADKDRIRFSSDGVAQSFLAASGNQGRVQLEYRLEQDPDHKTVNETPVFTLVREELPVGSSDADFLQSHRVVFPVAENVHSFNVRFQKNGKWLDEWTSSNTGFPEIVEISIGIVNDSGQVERFRISVAVSRKLKAFTTIGANPTN